MLIRLGQGEALHKEWEPLADIATALAEAVVAAEDNRFCEHWGFDWPALKGEIDAWRAGERAARRQHDHHADRQEPVPVARSQPAQKGARGAAHAADRGCCGPSGGSSRSISTSSSSGPASTAPRRRRRAIFGKPAARSEHAARRRSSPRSCPSPRALLAGPPERLAREPGAYHPYPHRAARPDAGVRARGLIGSARLVRRPPR